MGTPKDIALFIDEIEAVCEKHSLCICVSGYDSIQIYNKKSCEKAIYSNGIEDMTNEKDADG